MSQPMPADTTREPCPDRIIDDFGGAFGMGAVGGYAFHFFKGIRNSPKGHRLAGSVTAARMNAGRIGGSFAVWGGLFSTIDCALVYARQREDPWNSVVAGAATGGLLSARLGLLASGRSAIFGGVILAFFEGAGMVANRLFDRLPPLDDQQYPGQDTVQGVPSFLGVPPTLPIPVEELPVPESGPTGWFCGFFGKKKHEQVAANRGPMSETLELDLPSTAIPTFDYK